jgi:small-conductance mechanosensitive channel
MSSEILDYSLWGFSVLSWLKLAGITAGVTAALILVRRIVFGRFAAMAERTENRVDDVIAELLGGLRTFFLVVVSFYAAVEFIAIDAPNIPWLYRVVFVGFMIQLGLSGNDLIRVSVGWYLEKKDGESSQITAARALGLVGKMVLWLIVLLLMLDNFGIDITALVAGLGIGGIAIALAVQNVLSDLLAYFSIVADQPFSYGDFLVVGEFSGTVEHIGIKTTRIRSLSGEQVIISNNDLLGSRVRNFKRMNERRVLFAIGVTYDTPRSLLETIPGILKDAVESQENVRYDRGHLKAFGDYSINYEVVYFMLVPEYVTMMDTQQAINLRIHEEFSKHGIEFAFPSQTLYLEKGSSQASA